MNARIRIALCMLGLCAGMSTAPALVSAESNSSLALPTVTVTAQKIEQSVQDVPGTVAVFSDETLPIATSRHFTNSSSTSLT